MKCKDFLGRFSEFYDEQAVDNEVFEGHLEACPRCRRYVEVVRRGALIFRSLPALPLRDDFRPRLQHRIYHVDEEDRLVRRGSGSAARLGTGLVAAALLVLAVWSPDLMQEAPQVVLPAIIVSQPPSTRAARAEPGPRFESARFMDRPLEGDELWDRALYEYSPLSDRYPPERLFRTGLD